MKTTKDARWCPVCRGKLEDRVLVMERFNRGKGFIEAHRPVKVCPSCKVRINVAQWNHKIVKR